jgi:cell filamentation protein
VPGYTPGDGETLKNTLGATSYVLLDTAEVDFVSNRLLQFELGHGPIGSFDAAHLKAIHRHLFQDVYEWAGHTRDETVALSDGTEATEPLLRKADGNPFMFGPDSGCAWTHRRYIAPSQPSARSSADGIRPASGGCGG